MSGLVKMSNHQEKQKFVSSIPNNKLEPVFIGRPETDLLPGSVFSAEKKSSVYVPEFLKNKQEGQYVEKEVAKKQTQKKPQLTVNDFPDLLASKKKGSDTTLEGKSVSSGQTCRSSYLDMLLKVKAKEPVPTKESVEEATKMSARKGMLVLGRNMDNHKTLRSWADEDNEELDYSKPVSYLNNYEDQDEEEEEEEEEEFDKYYKGR